MMILPQYPEINSGLTTSSIEESEAVQALESSLRSSKSLYAIVQCARSRLLSRKLDTKQLAHIEEICLKYERHQIEVRDHCLDYYNATPARRISPEIHNRTIALVTEGKSLFSQLRETLFSTY
jgi:hypothetical protein